MSVKNKISATTVECFDKLRARCDEYDFVGGVMSFVTADDDRREVIEYLDSHPDADKWDVMEWVFHEFVENDDDDDGEYPLG